MKRVVKCDRVNACQDNVGFIKQREVVMIRGVFIKVAFFPKGVDKC